MKKLGNFLIGLIFLIVGGTMFLRNITVTSNSDGVLSGFLTTLFGGTNSSPKQVTGILLVLVFVTLLILFIRRNIVTISAFLMSILVMVFSIISSLQLSFASMSGLELVIIVGMLIIGLGMTIGNGVSLQREAELSEKQKEDRA